jgi:HAD superfamily hydrolase (TIGR01509 family)
MTFAAVLFDLDGTLIDTERLTIAAALEAFAAQGVAADEALLHRLIGVDDATGAARLRARHPDIDLAALDRDWTAAARRRQVKDGIPLKPGVLELLDRLGGLPVAVVTSSTREGAARKLALTGLAARFRVVVTFDDVRNPKPAAEPYERGAARLGVDPTQCLVFEDSETGARAGTAAGCFVVQVPDILPTRGEHARIVAPDLMTGARMAGLIGA